MEEVIKLINFITIVVKQQKHLYKNYKSTTTPSTITTLPSHLIPRYPIPKPTKEQEKGVKGAALVHCCCCFIYTIFNFSAKPRKEK